MSLNKNEVRGSSHGMSFQEIKRARLVFETGEGVMEERSLERRKVDQCQCHPNLMSGELHEGVS